MTFSQKSDREYNWTNAEFFKETFIIIITLEGRGRNEEQEQTIAYMACRSDAGNRCADGYRLR
jgi:hypothetical protein